MPPAAGKGRRRPEPVVPVRWHLREQMARADVRFARELHERVVAAGADLSYSAVAAVVKDPPAELSMGMLAALCAALGCQPGDLLTVQLPGRGRGVSPSTV